MGDGVRRLSAFPRGQLIEEPLFTARTSELGLLERLGPPTQASEPLAEDPCFYWDLVWPCGLVMGIELHQLDERLAVRLGGDEVEHARRHLAVELSEIELLRDTDPARYRELVGDPAPAAWEVWSDDGQGRPTRLHAGLTSADAHCLVEELSRSGQRTRYWARCAEPGGG
ncbi:hypothetical protein [Rhabdothermincola sp.]|uniref:hypothetical protein n=1 Tax=Rhabdothermincola sp. TaxID=2820405 RepID=UPI002FE31933